MQQLGIGEDYDGSFESLYRPQESSDIGEVLKLIARVMSVRYRLSTYHKQLRGIRRPSVVTIA